MKETFVKTAQRAPHRRLDEEDVAQIYDGILTQPSKGYNFDICDNVDGS